MTPIFGEEKIFGKLVRVVSLHTPWSKNFDEIALSDMVKAVLYFNKQFCVLLVKKIVNN